MPATARPDERPNDRAADPRPALTWHVRLLGAVDARQGDRLITRFNSQPTAALLARLALQPQRLHPREELAELLWPGAPADSARNRLRQALSTLKHLLEPAGGPPVLIADRLGVRVAEGALECDAQQFERAFRQRRHAQARALYRGELMPGYYAEWVQDERQRLASLFDLLDEVDAGAPRAPLLPTVLTRFFGREAELAALQAAVEGERLVTLSGVGGCGKTRLAIEVARAARGFDGVAFVPLADCATVEQALAQIGPALQAPPGVQGIQGVQGAQGIQGALDALLPALAQRRLLLVLDNFEQLVAAGGGALVEQLLGRAPALHLLVTSRRVLGLPGEHERPLAPLPLPEAGAPLDALRHNAGAALFVDRARSVRADFELTAANHEALAALCRALEGVPLALELAAARCRAFSLRELHDALARPLQLLERSGSGNGGASGRLPRHDSLRGAIEWSWRLLDGAQQDFAAALSVFRGGWTVADAQAVCDEPRARDRLESLVADSLVRAEVTAQGGMRFRMLELIREFVADKIEPARAATLRAQHRAHVLAQALGLQARGAAALDPDELPNVQQAIRTALDDGQAELALTLGNALRSHWDSQGIAPEMLSLLCRAADGTPAGVPALTAACTMLAGLQLVAGQLPLAHALAERALVLAEGRGAARAAALCAWVRVMADGERRYEGLAARLDEALRLAAGQPEIEAQVLGLQGTLQARALHDPVAAEALFEGAAARWLAAGHLRQARLLRYDRAVSLLNAPGRLAEALRQAELCESECQQIGELARRVAAINLQGVILARQRRWAEALQAYGRCVREAWAHHQHYWLAFALWNHGRNLARLRQPEAAARLMAFTAGHWTAHYAPLGAADRLYLRQVRRLVRAQMGSARAEVAWREGESMTLPQAVALSQLLVRALAPAAAV